MLPRTCPVCGKIFEPITKRHIFCNRRCFKTAYRKKTKKKSFPIFVCPGCKTKIELDFHPKDSKKAWEKFRCPFCGYSPMEDEEIMIETTLSIITKGLFE